MPSQSTEAEDLRTEQGIGVTRAGIMGFGPVTS